MALESTAAPAFSTDTAFRITGWNTALEHLLGYPAAHAVGVECCEIFGGRDVFGNPYCGRSCGVRQALLRNETVRSFEMEVATSTGRKVRVVCTTLLVNGETEADSTIVHLMQPASTLRGRHPDPACELSETEVGVTARQLQILRYLADGWTNQAVAGALGISVATVRTHVSNILRRLEVHNLRQAIAAARRAGLL